MAFSRLYHNARCSKSREALALLQARGIEPELVFYLDTPPDAPTLRELLALLGLPAHALVRTAEAAYAQLGLSADSSENALIDAMTTYPRLIERPVFVHGGRAVIGRPPERVLSLLD